MIIDDERDDVLAAVTSLRTYDVSARRARDLRTRCHAALAPQPRRTRSANLATGTVFRRVIGPALGGAWCVWYLVEIIGRAAAIYRLPH